MVIAVEAFVAVDGTLLPKESVALPCAIRGINVPSPHPLTVRMNDVPLEALMLRMQPVAVPALLKSPELTPETESV
jgi:hypothetical protein